MTREERLELSKQIEKDIHVCSSKIEKLEQETFEVSKVTESKLMNKDEIYKRLNILRGMAEHQDFKNGKGRYKWELGILPYTAIESTLMNLVNYYDGKAETQGIELMGIPVDDPNYKEPEVIKLWRQVEE